MCNYQHYMKALDIDTWTLNLSINIDIFIFEYRKFKKAFLNCCWFTSDKVISIHFFTLLN